MEAKIIMPQRILAVDDEPLVLALLVYNLRNYHYDVLTALDGRQALRLAQEQQPDLIVLDLMLPEIDGLDVCRELRRSSQIPIIMVTARGEEVDRVVGLELGADDYLCKPFSVRELLARIKAVLRRVPAQADQSLPTPSAFLVGPGHLRLKVEQREAFVQTTLLDLSKLEFDLLHTFLSHAGRVLSREQLLSHVWGYDYPGDDRAVDSAIKRLRAKLRAVDPEADGITG